jgi:hypothetical protein
VVLDELAAEAGEDGRAVGKARAVLLADAGGRASDANTIRGDDATDRKITEEKGGEKSVREIDEERSRLRGQVQGGTESLSFSTEIAALVFPYRWRAV